MNTDTEPAAAQPLLFDSLPETTPARRPARRARAATLAEPIAVDAVREPAPLPAAPGLAAAPVAPPASPVASGGGITPAEPFDPAALTNPELRALVQALPDLRLAFLVVEAAREVKRRVAPDPDDDADGLAEPNPSLLRAARLAVGELSGEDV